MKKSSVGYTFTLVQCLITSDLEQSHSRKIENLLFSHKGNFPFSVKRNFPSQLTLNAPLYECFFNLMYPFKYEQNDFATEI